MAWMIGNENFPSVMSSQKPFAAAILKNVKIINYPIAKKEAYFLGFEVGIIIVDLEGETERVRQRN